MLQSRARERLEALTPEADEVNAETSDGVEFFPAIENLESVRCPQCDAEIDLGWAMDIVRQRGEAGFTDLDMSVPGCGTTVSLNDLRWDWPQGLARFAIEAVNPDVDDLTASEIEGLSSIVDCELRVIWARY